ncbi:MAG: hypothetical protein KDK39_00760 [Leptospiraceae bacterium]|nr:hypothetical protein [Leptospiraceae bacterium]
MTAISRDQYVQKILDFILNQAREEDLDLIDAALKRRGRAIDAAAIDFRSMAEQITSRFDFEMPDFHGMSRDMVKNIILENVEQISARDLEILLDHYVPRTREQPVASAADKGLEPALLQKMLQQFISFSLGRMPGSEDSALRQQMPDWPERYWNSFDEPTKAWIRKTIRESSV